MATSPSKRGKVAEALVSKELKLLATRLDFDFERITDAYSSRGGATTARPGDFLAFQAGKAVVIEVKEVAHEYRLPRQNFPLDQRARLRKRHLAGCSILVLVYSSVSKLWRILPIAEFGVETTGSWDMRETSAGALRLHLEQVFNYGQQT